MLNSILGSNTNAFPFQVTTRKVGGAWQAYINPLSSLLQSARPNDNVTITGLGEWFTLISTDVIAVYIVISNYTVVSATIQSKGMGNSNFNPDLTEWSSTNESYVFDDGGSPPKQIGANILIAYTTPDANGNPYLIQCQTDHLLLENSCIDGEPALYDYSHRQRYGITI